MIFKLVTSTGGTYSVTLQRVSDDYWWNEDTPDWEASEPSFADKKISLTEGTGDYLGYYSGEAADNLGNGLIHMWVHDEDNSNQIVYAATINLISGEQADPADVTGWGNSQTIDNYTPSQVMAILLGVAAGKISGAGLGSPVIRSANDSKDRITATTDTDGNRLSVTIDVSDY